MLHTIYNVYLSVLLVGYGYTSVGMECLLGCKRPGVRFPVPRKGSMTSECLSSWTEEAEAEDEEFNSILTYIDCSRLAWTIDLSPPKYNQDLSLIYLDINLKILNYGKLRVHSVQNALTSSPLMTPSESSPISLTFHPQNPRQMHM